jgi:hypothetical protein
MVRCGSFVFATGQVGRQLQPQRNATPNQVLSNIALMDSSLLTRRMDSASSLAMLS